MDEFATCIEVPRPRTERDYLLSPPSSKVAMVHWKILTMLISGLSEQVQEQLKGLTLKELRAPSQGQPSAQQRAPKDKSTSVKPAVTTTSVTEESSSTVTKKPAPTYSFPVRDVRLLTEKGYPTPEEVAAGIGLPEGFSISGSGASKVSGPISGRPEEDQTSKPGKSKRQSSPLGPNKKRRETEVSVKETAKKTAPVKASNRSAPKTKVSSVPSLIFTNSRLKKSTEVTTQEKTPKLKVVLEEKRHRHVDYSTSESVAMPRGIDTHFHVDKLLSKFRGDTLTDILRRTKVSPAAFELKKMVCSYAHPDSYPDVRSRVLLREEEPRLFFSYGWHPKAVGGNPSDDRFILEELYTLLGCRKTVALGEVGIDYSAKDHPSPCRQRYILRKVLPFALERNLPVVIHCRDKEDSSAASDDCLTVMQEILPKNHLIHRHCFNGSMDEYNEWLEAFPNTYFGFTGICTHKEAHWQLSAVIGMIPENRILLETDAPYLVPAKVDVQWNSPELLHKVAKLVANTRGMSIRTLMEAATRNAKAFFQI